MEVTPSEKLNRAEISALKLRWTTEDGERNRAAVTHALRRRIPLARLHFLEKFNDRYDLRGLTFHKPTAKPFFQTNTHNIEILADQVMINKVSLSNVDLSYSDLSESKWDRCNFENIRFDHATIKNCVFWVSNFTNVSFQYADLRDTSLGAHKNLSTGSFVNVEFSYADLRSTGHYFEIYQDCDFSFSDLQNVNFDGARFSRCKFAGMVDGTQFRLRRRSIRSMILGRKIDAPHITNPMEDIDFSAATLYGVDFDGVDLSTCALPQDKDHLIIHNQRTVFERAHDMIEREWEGENKRIGLNQLNNWYMKASKAFQPIQIVNKNLENNIIGVDFGEKFFALLKKITESSK